MSALQLQLIAGIIVFLRLTGVFLFAPGISSRAVPVRVRLFLAIILSISLAPGVTEPAIEVVKNASISNIGFILVKELAVGAVLGLSIRILFNSFEAFGVIVSFMIGLNNSFVSSSESNEQIPAIASLVNIIAILFFFISDLHWLLLSGFITSYQAIGIGSGISPQASLIHIVDVSILSIVSAVKMATPLIILSLVINGVSGLINRMIQQVPIYFVSMPFLSITGLFVLFLTLPAAIMFMIQILRIDILK